MMHPEQHEGAFVVQFRKATGAAAWAFVGRVEHVASGKVGHFDSPEKLTALLSSMLAETHASRRDESIDRQER